MCKEESESWLVWWVLAALERTAGGISGVSVWPLGKSEDQPSWGKHWNWPKQKMDEAAENKTFDCSTKWRKSLALKPGCQWRWRNKFRTSAIMIVNRIDNTESTSISFSKVSKVNTIYIVRCKCKSYDMMPEQLQYVYILYCIWLYCMVFRRISFWYDMIWGESNSL